MDRNTDLAEDRTDWAEDRTVLANERTFASWVRTGLAALGIAVAIEAIFTETDPTWMAKATASIFVGAAVVIFLSAYFKSRHTSQRLTTHSAEEMDASNQLLISLVFVAGSGGIGLLLWLI